MGEIYCIIITISKNSVDNHHKILMSGDGIHPSGYYNLPCNEYKMMPINYSSFRQWIYQI